MQGLYARKVVILNGGGPGGAEAAIPLMTA